MLQGEVKASITFAVSMASAYANEVANLATSYGIERMLETNEFQTINEKVATFEKKSKSLSDLQ